MACRGLPLKLSRWRMEIRYGPRTMTSWSLHKQEEQSSYGSCPSPSDPPALSPFGLAALSKPLRVRLLTTQRKGGSWSFRSKQKALIRRGLACGS